VVDEDNDEDREEGEEQTIDVNASVSIRLSASAKDILICPFGCTAMGDSTQLACLRCGLVYCLACLNSDLGPMFGTNRRGDRVLKCADCGENPRVLPIAERPPWQSLSSAKAKKMLPSVGPARKAEDKVWEQSETRNWMSSLRAESAPPSRRESDSRSPSAAPSHAATPSCSRSSSATGSQCSSTTPSERGNNMPAVFDRLTSPRTYSGMHRHRFTEDGVGRGLAGRRDDTSLQRNIAGLGQITRDDDPDMDRPGEDPLEKRAGCARPRRSSSSGKANISSMDAYTDPVMTRGVFSRLIGYSPSQSRSPGEYERSRKAATPFTIAPSVSRIYSTK
jgi:hypothetical protein